VAAKKARPSSCEREGGYEKYLSMMQYLTSRGNKTVCGLGGEAGGADRSPTSVLLFRAAR